MSSLFLLYYGRGSYMPVGEWCLLQCLPYSTFDKAYDHIMSEVKALRKHRAVKVEEHATDDPAIRYYNIISQGYDKVWRVKNHFIIQEFIGWKS